MIETDCLSLRVAHTPSASVVVLLPGRVCLGGAERFSEITNDGARPRGVRP